MKPLSEQRWFTAIPLAYREQTDFWERDAGLLCLGFRALGMDARFAALGTPSVREDVPLILAELPAWEDPAWWRQWQLDGVVLFAWALKRYEPVARAIKAAGVQLVVKLDTDGLRGPRVWFRRYVTTVAISFKASGKPLPFLQALARSTVAWLLPRWHGRGTVDHLEYADLILIESPFAKQRYLRFLQHAGGAHLAPRLTVMMHPVTPDMKFDPAIPKTNLIVAVGGWNRLVKDAPLLIKVLGRVLAREPDYRARIIGAGEAELQKLTRALPAEVRSRIEIAGLVPHHHLHFHFQAAQIIINTSYSESFCLALAEALCCGSSVVGTALMGSLNYFVSTASGTLSCDRRPDNFCDALRAEIEAWRLGWRDPSDIAKIWSARVSAPEVARHIVEALERVTRENKAN